METAPRRRKRPKLIGNGTLKVGYVLPETGQLAFLGIVGVVMSSSSQFHGRPT
jgi:hypothetical protein